MDLRHPKSAVELDERNQLLQLALRPTDPLFPVAAEYPIVLAPEARDLSHCLFVQNRLMAHATLWPRILRHQSGESVAIGLVGNVATHPDFQGQGHMRQLLESLEQKAKNLDLKALFLWSDLSSFYQKLGFTSSLHERRFTFKRETLAGKTAENRRFLPTSLTELTTLGAARLLASRFRVGATIQRNVDEYVKLARIPFATLLADQATGPNEPLNYVLYGKGYDLAGVIHEWGAAQPEDLVDAVATMFALTALNEVIVLAPWSLPVDWRIRLSAVAVETEHAMAMHKVLVPGSWEKTMLADMYIWGLDSI